jgi:hypothetical protein
MVEVIERKECTGLKRYVLIEGALVLPEEFPQIEKGPRVRPIHLGNEGLPDSAGEPAYAADF